MTPVRLEPAAPRSRVKHSTTEPLRSLKVFCIKPLDKFPTVAFLVKLVYEMRKARSRPEVIKHFSRSTQLGVKF